MKSLSTATIMALLFTPPVTMAQSPAPAQPTKPAAAENSLNFSGKTFTLGDVSRSKGGAKNIYYLKGDSAKSWIQRVEYSIHPGQSDINAAMQSIMGFYKQGKHEIEVGKLATPRIVSFYAYEKHPKHHQFNIHCLHNGANGKGVIVRTFSVKNLPKNEQAFRAQTGRLKEKYLSSLASAKFPKFVLNNSSANATKPPAENIKIPPLKTITEKVTDIQGKGKLHTIDEAFAKENGAKPGGHRPFSVVVPDSDLGKAMLTSRPQIPDVVRFTLVAEGNKVMESIRFTSVTIGTNDEMPKRLQRAASIVESQLVPKFFAGRKNAKIGMRYRTKVGPYDAACLLGRFTAEDGTMFYIKFVAILEEKNPNGVLAIMMLNPTGDKPLNVKKRLQDGFAQRVLHSVRMK